MCTVPLVLREHARFDSGARLKSDGTVMAPVPKRKKEKANKTTMDDEKSSVARWTVVDPGESEWSIVSDTDGESEWSMPNDFDDILLLHDVSDTPKRATRISLLQQAKEEDADGGDEDSYRAEYDLHYQKVRVGKKALKHSLVKRCCPWEYGSPASGWRSDDCIEVTRRGKDEYGLCPKTPIDDMLPELLTNWCATLGRANRWKDVKGLFDQLEQEGTAVRVTVPVDERDMYMRFTKGRYCEPPSDSTRYVVKSNDTYKDTSRRYGHIYAMKNRWSGQEVYCWQRGRWRVWYELTSEPPAEIEEAPLRATLHAPPGTSTLDGRARRAFSPGVALTCGAASTTSHVVSAERAVVERAVDLVFGLPVSVTHASIAGKIHKTRSETLFMSKAEDYPPRYYNSTIVVPDDVQRKQKWCNIAVEGTDAYCDRVEISARLVGSPRTWIVLGTFAGCKDGHTEKAIYLGDCHAASGTGAVLCIALRFRAVSWHNKPLLRVGAYGHDDKPLTNDKAREKVFPSDDTGFEDGVEYTLYCAKHRHDGNDALFRQYAKKEGRSCHKEDWPRRSKEMKRAKQRADIKDALK